MKNYIYLLLLIFLNGCDIINPEEQIPAFIEFGAFEMQANPLVNHGSLDHRIEKGWLFVGDELIGVVTLPSTIPVYLSGEQEIKIDPMVHLAGQSQVVRIYPFCERFIQNVTLTPGEVTKVQPTTNYIDEAVFAFVEDFESSTQRFTDIRTGAVEIVATEIDAFENKSGRIRLDLDNPVAEIATNPTSLYDLRSGGKTYLEVNYKSEAEVLFGLVGHEGGTIIPNYEFGIFPKDSWNKIYFELTNQVISSDFPAYQISILAGLPVNNDGTFTIDEANILLDNIKLIHF